MASKQQQQPTVQQSHDTEKNTYTQEIHKLEQQLVLLQSKEEQIKREKALAADKFRQEYKAIIQDVESLSNKLQKLRRESDQISTRIKVRY